MVGKYVYLKSDKDKILYKVKEVSNDICTIIGVYFRILKTCKVEDITAASQSECLVEKDRNENKLKRLEQINIRNRKYHCGIILHIDGDSDYLNRCIELYQKVGVFSYGIKINEKDIGNEIKKYIISLNPDVVVITGHDSYNGEGLKDLGNYTNTGYFCEAVKEIRKFKSKSDVVVIAGACQSNFEALIASGANFASSPKRLNIHTYDPAVLAIKAATTDFKKIISINNIEKYIENGKDAFGGVESFGKMRMLL